MSTVIRVYNFVVAYKIIYTEAVCLELSRSDLCEQGMKVKVPLLDEARYYRQHNPESAPIN